jgi:hypothetical protein
VAQWLLFSLVDEKIGDYSQCIGDYSCNYRGLFYPPKIGDYDNERGESRF